MPHNKTSLSIKNIKVTVEYDMIVVVKIYSSVMGNYFTVSFLLSANKNYILLCGRGAYKCVL